MYFCRKYHHILWFYAPNSTRTAAVYCGAAGISRTRHTIPAALFADAVMFVCSAWAVRVVFGT